MSSQSVQEYILSKCKQLCPYFDPKETFHAFCGARSKSSRGDWIIEPSEKDGHFIHVAGIDSPGLAGSPAIAIEVVRLLREAGLDTPPNTSFNPNRAPIIIPKAGKYNVLYIIEDTVLCVTHSPISMVLERDERAQNGPCW